MLAVKYESSEDHSAINLQLGGCTEFSALPYILSQSSKGCTGFDNSAVDFGIYVDLSDIMLPGQVKRSDPLPVVYDLSL